MTSAQQRIARLLAEFARLQQPGFVVELVKELGLAAESSLTPTLRIMHREGWVEIAGGGAKGRSRVVRLTAQGRRAVGLGGLPLLGRIAAGNLTEALAEPEQLLEDADLLPYRTGDFLLRVHGDSMIGDGILDGDKVLLRPNVDWHDGEIAAAMVGNEHEATLKRVFREGRQVRLQPSNPQFSAVMVDADKVKIAGVFRGLIRDQRH